MVPVPGCMLIHQSTTQALHGWLLLIAHEPVAHCRGIQTGPVLGDISSSKEDLADIIVMKCKWSEIEAAIVFIGTPRVFGAKALLFEVEGLNQASVSAISITSRSSEKGSSMNTPPPLLGGGKTHHHTQAQAFVN